MKKDNDFGLKDFDLKKRKITGYKKPINFLIILIVLTGIYLLYYKNIDTSNTLITYNESENKNHIIDSLKSENLNTLNTPLSDTLKSEKENSIQKIDSDNVPLRFTKEIIELDSLTGNYFIIEGSFSNYNLSLNRAKFLLDNGFQPIIIFPKNNNMHRVAVDVYMDLDDAKESLEAYKNKLNNKLWILRH
tara:strand:- start:2837 stop:3406 length:570 start_codon:yes stop_codon:yes gene_type:complete